VGGIEVIAAEGHISAGGMEHFGYIFLYVFFFVFLLVVVRAIQRWFGRSLKAQQDLARAAADMAERLERIEKKLDQQDKGEGRSG